MPARPLRICTSNVICAACASAGTHEDALSPCGNPAELLVEGEEMNPVVFQGEQPTLGRWQGIRVNGAVQSTSRIACAGSHHGGGLATPVLAIQARVTLDHLAVEDDQLGIRHGRGALPEVETPVGSEPVAAVLLQFADADVQIEVAQAVQPAADVADVRRRSATREGRGA